MPKKDSTTTPDDAGAPEPLKVLIAWRDGDSGTEAISFAAWLARTTPIRVRAVTVFTRPWPTTSLNKLGKKYRKWLKKESARYAAAIKKELAAAGLPKEFWDDEVSVFLDGTSETALLTQAATAFDAHLVVLGSQGGAPKGRFRAGSTADAMLHSSPRPLGLMPRSVKLSKRGVTRITCAFVDTDDASDLINSAADLAHLWHIPLRVITFAPEELTEDLGPNFDLESELTHEWREHSLAFLDRVHDAVLERHPQLSVTTEIGSGKGWSEAMNSLKWKKGDLLYVGSTPLGHFERVFIGSTTTEILHHTPVPMLIKPAASR
ncbi:universal stress protein [Corynebacterium sp.]|uniref:universal stress protein n=1 Tax=Corynebacterium sp. TaxID=1720 RepID=UPI0026DBAA00|nr:universal stress protein [Corynebacterium sp.]MDO5077584.1 universal stress protein [Corynebacterium sp.]